MTKKITNKKALSIAINNIVNSGLAELWDGNDSFSADEVISKLEAMVAALDNKVTATKRKPTATQKENIGLRAAIMDFLRANPNLIVTCTDLSKKVAELDGLNNQRISALMRGLKDEGKVEKLTERGKTFFRLAKDAPAEDEDDPVQALPRELEV